MTFFKKTKSFTIGFKVFNLWSTVLRNPPDCTILDSWVFDNYIFSDKIFAKALQSLENCVLINNNLYRKLVPSLESPIIFDGTFEVSSVTFFTLDFNLLSYEFTFKLLNLVILNWYYV